MNINDNLQFIAAYFSNETEDIINWVANPPGGWVGKYEQTSTKKKREIAKGTLKLKSIGEILGKTKKKC